MTFNAYPFLIFLPIVFLAYWLLPRKGQNLLIAVASSIFYGWWDWHFLPLLWFSTVIDFVAGIQIERARSERGRKAWLLVSIVTQLGMLFTFKYLDFGIRSMQSLLESVGFHPNLSTLNLILPVGISFYTFQTLSYTIDVYRRQLRATKDFVEFTAFVSFFPQLVAGPIERASHLLGQFQTERKFDTQLAVDGCRQILYGMFLKTVVGDNCARIADGAFDPAHFDQTSGVKLLLGAYMFAFQIYGDFAGYSHMAIGCGRLFGFDLMRNFAYPYFSRNLAEFWHRWHISLSTWFRDYVYIPLGGGRVPPWRRRLNVFITFVLSGIWHGAGFNFLIWGAVHGAAVALNRGSSPTVIDEPCGRGLRPRLRDVAQVLLTFHIVCAAWIFFRIADTGRAFAVLAKIASAALHPFGGDTVRGQSSDPAMGIFAIVGLTVLIEWVQRNKPHGLAIAGLTRPVRWAIYASVVLAIAAIGRQDEVPFIYFQF